MIDLINTGRRVSKSRNAPEPLVQWKVVTCPPRDAAQLQSMNRFIYQAEDFFERLASTGPLRFSDQHVIQLCRNTNAVALDLPWREYSKEQVLEMRTWLATWIRALSNSEELPVLHIAADPSAKAEESSEIEGVEEVAIDDLNRDQLRAALRERGLPTSGKAEELRARLTDAVIAEQS